MEDKKFLERVGKNIADVRKKRELTQLTLSEDLGIHRTALTRIERGNTNITLLQLKKIAEKLKVSIDTLLG